MVPLDEHVSLAVAAYDPGADIVAHKAVKPRYSPTLRLWIEKDRRNRRRDIVPPQAKVAANYTSPMFAKWAARRAGYDEILLVDQDGFVAEGPTTNVFWVDAAGVVRTPPEEKVLLGVTRRSILEIARHDGLPVAESKVRPEQLMAAHEVFLTGTTAGVWPVASVDDHPIGDGQPGPVSARLKARFQTVVSGRRACFRALARQPRSVARARPTHGRCASSRARSPRRATSTSATTSARCASTSRSRSQHEALYFIADYHSMNSVRDADERRRYTLAVALDYLACGLDPQRAILFRQSDVPEVCELAWLLSTLTPMGLLERAHAYKDKLAQGQSRRSRALRLPGADGGGHPALPRRSGAGGPGPEAAHRDDARHGGALQPRLRRGRAEDPRALHPGRGGGGARHGRAQDEQVLRQHRSRCSRRRPRSRRP